MCPNCGSTTQTKRFEVVLVNALLKRDEDKCNSCYNRFSCWTSYLIGLPVLHFTIERNFIDIRIKVITEALECLLGINILGNKIIVREEQSEVVFRGTVTNVLIEDYSKMTIIARGVEEYV